MFLEREIERPSVGKLIIIGGRENKVRGPILPTVVKSLPEGSLLGVAPLATEDRDSYWEDYRVAFHKFGLGEERTIPLLERHHLLEHLNNNRTTAVVIPGGRQDELVNVLGDKGLETLNATYATGGVIVGSSAGSCMGEHMIVGKEDGTFEIQPGLGLTKKIILDNHFSQRHRQIRLIQTVVAVAGWYPEDIPPVGMGIDEDTAVVVTNDRFAEVVGTGSVTVYDFNPHRHDGNPPMEVYVLESGSKYDLDRRMVI